MSHSKLTLLFDGGCPLCRREVSFLRSRDHLNKITFVDIDSPSYKPELYQGITYRAAMGSIHAISSTGKTLKGVQVFQEAYRLVGLAWVYAPSSLPVLNTLFDKVYRLWARWRLPFTRRPSLDKLCRLKDLEKKGL